MPHNHSPRCCCEPTYNGAIVTSAKPCPSCIEHGELATLGNNAPITDNPPAECPSCHTTDGHPHTDYCQAPASQPRCQTVDVDGEPIRIQGSGGHISPAASKAIAAVVRATRDAMAQPLDCQGTGHEHEEELPDCRTCTTQPSIDRAREARAAQATTSQPAATTSQPHTQQRPEFIDTCRCQRSLPGQITGYDHHPLCQHHPHQAGGPGPTPIE